MKVLITGGAGFIGSHLADRFLKEGFEVRILDSLEPRVHPHGIPAYVPGSAEFMLGDVTDRRMVLAALQGVDVVSHQAAYQDYMPDFSRFLQVNAVSTALLFELILGERLPVKKFIVAPPFLGHSCRAGKGDPALAGTSRRGAAPGERSGRTLLASGLWRGAVPLWPAWRLSAGSGLVPIRGTPLLAIWLELCRESGITELLINVHAHAECIERYLAEGRAPCKVRIVREEHLLGSAGTVQANRDWVEAEAAFYILYSDVLTNTNLKQMMDFHLRQGKLGTLGLYQVPDPARCGVAQVDENGIITGFEEKPKIPRSDWVFSGLMIASPKILDVCPAAGIRADIGFDLLPRLVGQLMAYPITDYLLDIGTLPNYETAQKTWPAKLPVPQHPCC